MKIFILIQFLLLNILNSLISQSIHVNDNCESAILINNGYEFNKDISLTGLDANECNYGEIVNGVWFRYVGKGRILNLDYHNQFTASHSFYKGNCDSLICISKNQNSVFINDGEEIFILVYQNPSNNYFEKTKVTFKEYDVSQYDNCASTPVIDCDTTFNIETITLSYDNLIPQCGSEQKYFWLKILGDGSLKNINITNPNTSFSYTFSLYYSESGCDVNRCVNLNFNNSFTFNSIPGKEYLFYAYTYDPNIDEIKVSVSCEENNIDYGCTSIKLLNCDDKYSEQYIEPTVPDLFADPYSPFLYKIEGNGLINEIKIVNLFPNSQGVSCNLYEIDNTDTSDICLKKIGEPILNIYLYSETQSLYFFGDSSKTYYATVGSYYPNFSIQYICNRDESVFNNTCKNSLTVECGRTYELINNDSWFDLSNIVNEVSIELPIDFNGNLSIYNIDSCNFFNPPIYSRHSFGSDVKNLIARVNNKDGINLWISKFSTNNYPIKFTCLTDSEGLAYCEKAIDILENETKILTLNNHDYVDLSNINCKKDFHATQWLKFIGTGKYYRISTNYDIDIFRGDCDSLICPDEVQYTYNSIRFSSIENSVYYIKVYFTDFEETEFRLEEFNIPENAVCENAFLINCNIGAYNIDFNNYYFTDNPSDSLCNYDLLESWFELEGNNSLVNLSIGSGDQSIIHVYENSCDSLKCNFNSIGNEVRFYAESGKNYKISVKYLYGQMQSTMYMTCIDNPQDVDCSTATFAHCDSLINLDFLTAVDNLSQNSNYEANIYKKFLGTGESINFEFSPFSYFLRFEIYNEDCTEFLYSNGKDSTYVDIQSTPAFKTDSGKIYTIIFYANRHQTIAISINCTNENLIGYSCSNAISIECNSSIIHSPLTSHNLAYLGGYYSNAMWYSIAGNDQILRLNVNQTNGNVFYGVFKTLDDCGNLHLVTYSNIFDIPIYLEEGYQYYILFSYNFHSGGNEDIELIWTCNTDESIVCNSAKSLTCNETYAIPVTTYTDNVFGECTLPNTGNWFTIEGENTEYGVTIVNNNTEDIFPVTAYLGEGNCDTIICIQKYLITSNKPNFQFQGEDGKKYLVKLTRNNSYTSLKNTSVELSCNRETQNTSCNDATFIECNSQFSGFTKNLSIDSFNSCNEISAGLFYKIIGDGDLYEFNITNVVGSNFKVKIFEDDCVNGRCLYELDNIGSNSIFTIDTRNNVEYIIKFINVGSAGIKGTLSCFEMHENVNCNNASNFNCDDTVSLKVNTPLGFNNLNPCGSNNYTPHWYKLPNRKGTYEINVIGTELQKYQTYLVHLTGSCNDYQCISSYSATNRNFIQINNDLDNYIYIYSLSYGFTSNIDVTITCAEASPNDECINAELLSCEELKSLNFIYANPSVEFNGSCVQTALNDIWYKVIGDGTVKKLNFDNNNPEYYGTYEIFENTDCSNLRCINYGEIRKNGFPSAASFSTDETKEYLIRISGDNFSNNEPIKFNMSCQDAILNDLCQYATNIDHDTLLQINAGYASSENLPDGCKAYGYGGIWYKIENNDSLLVFKSNDYNISLQVYEGQCDSLLCVNSTFVNQNYPYKLQLSKDKTYFIYCLFLNDVEWIDQVFEIAFEEVIENDSCSQSTDFLCDSTYTYNINSILDEVNISCGGFNTVSAWHRLQGDNSIHTIEITEPGLHSIGFADQCDVNCNYINYFPNLYSFYTKEDKEYLLSLNFYNSLNLTGKIKHSCYAPKNTNIIKENADSLYCKKYEYFPNETAPVFDDCFGGQYKNVWYKFKGNGKTIKISRKYISGLEYKIIDNFCNAHYYFNTDDDNYFNTIEGLNYYLLVSSYGNTSNLPIKDSFDVEFNCIVSTDEIDDNNQYGIIPNPSSGKAYLKIVADKQDNSSLLILKTIDGRQILRRPVEIKIGENIIPIDLDESINQGIYIVEVVHSGLTKRLKYIITK